MRKLSLQWRLTILTTVLITVLCGCLTFFLYKNGVYYFNTLQETVTDQNGTPDAIYIDIPDDEWDDFAAQFATKVYNSKSDYRNRSLLITAVQVAFGGKCIWIHLHHSLCGKRRPAQSAGPRSRLIRRAKARHLRCY